MSNAAPPVSEERIKELAREEIAIANAQRNAEKPLWDQFIAGLSGILGHLVALAVVFALVCIVSSNAHTITSVVLERTKTLVGLGILLYTGKEATRTMRETVNATNYGPAVAARDISLAMAGVGAGAVLIFA